MPSTAERESRIGEKKISLVEREELVTGIVAEAKNVFDPQLVFKSTWQNLEPYAPLIAMISKLEYDPSLLPHQVAHLRKMTAWQASSVNRKALGVGSHSGVRGHPKLWRIVDEAVGRELATIDKFPDDLEGVPESWKDALFDVKRIETPEIEDIE